MGTDWQRKNERQRRIKRERRADWMKDKVCAQCGSTDRLEVDHIDPKTKDQRFRHSPSNLWVLAADKRAIELAKCQALCYICHRAKSGKELRIQKHGTLAMYKRGCRCEPCRVMKSLANAAFRSRSIKDSSS